MSVTVITVLTLVSPPAKNQKCPPRPQPSIHLTTTSTFEASKNQRYPVSAVSGCTRALPALPAPPCPLSKVAVTLKRSASRQSVVASAMQVVADGGWNVTSSTLAV